MNVIEFSGDIDDTLLEDIRAGLRQQELVIEILPRQTSMGFADPATITSVAGLIVSLVALLLEIKNAADKHTWNADKLSSVLKDELFSRNITKYQITRVSHLRNLIDGLDDPCQVEILDEKTYSTLVFSVYRSGDVHRVHVLLE